MNCIALSVWNAKRYLMLGFLVAAGMIPMIQAQDARKAEQDRKQGPAIVLGQQPPDPFGIPRPAAGSTGVPRRASIYLELKLESAEPGDEISTPTLAVAIQSAGGKSLDILRPGGQFAPGFTGWIKSIGNPKGAPFIGIYFNPAKPFDALTTYTVRVAARSLQGATMTPGDKLDRWSFTTADMPRTQNVVMNLDLATLPVHWQGLFFSGFVKVGFSDSAGGLEPSYEMMARDRALYPRAWVLKRDFWLTGMQHEPVRSFFPSSLPNIVRELETRRIAAITPADQGWLLKVGDFRGHEQYGIPSDRPLREDFQPGFEVLIADGKNFVRPRVITVDEAARTVLVDRFEMPKGGFLIDDPAKGERQPLPGTVGLFPDGGCYLRRFAPAGTPHYYWGRLDQEWDISRRYGWRVMVNFADAPGDLSNKGQNWCPPKDYAELHQTVRSITSHVIERYGAEAAYSYPWSIFNEPDLAVLFWHGSKAELNKFYDYSVDAILRAFEDHGLDSTKVFIGGLELGGISPNLPGLEEFLRHCSPDDPTTASINAACLDPRLDGKRSRRVEELCRAHGGKGAPVDFISIHTYNASANAAAKLKRAKDIALTVNPAYFEKLWISSHESTPNWMPSIDPAWIDVYLGDGYYPAWCADYVWRLLREGARDARYAMGDTILTYWPWPGGFGPSISATQTVKVDDDGDGKADREPTLPTPIYNFLNLLGSLGSDYWVLPEQTVAGHLVAGFASRGADGDLRVLLYAHDPADLQARAGQKFTVELNVSGLQGGAARVRQYQFDRQHHTSFELAQKIMQRSAARVLSPGEFQKLKAKLALNPNRSDTARPHRDGRLSVTTDLMGNGVTFLLVTNKP